MSNDPLISIAEWCKEQRASLKHQLDLLENGKVHLGEHQVAGGQDTTEDNIARVRRKIAELERILLDLL
jgi:hypothetical protein